MLVAELGKGITPKVRRIKKQNSMGATSAERQISLKILELCACQIDQTTIWT